MRHELYVAANHKPPQRAGQDQPAKAPTDLIVQASYVLELEENRGHGLPHTQSKEMLPGLKS